MCFRIHPATSANSSCTPAISILPTVAKDNYAGLAGTVAPNQPNESNDPPSQSGNQATIGADEDENIPSPGSIMDIESDQENM